MRIKAHKLDGVEYRAAANIGPEIVPTIVVLHDTAGPLTKGSSAAYLASKNTPGVSVHFVVETDGTITQLVPVNRRANHAGASIYHGREGCNAFSIGIEIVNPGRMDPVDRGDGVVRGRAWWGALFEDPVGILGLVRKATPQHGDGVWMSYPHAQIDAVVTLLSALFDGIKSLEAITTHWYVSPGRKVDVNPLFPLDQVRARVLGDHHPEDADAIEASEPAPAQQEVQVVAAGGLNLRSWPSWNPNVITSIPDGTALPVLRSVSIRGRLWHRVIYGGREGWILASYTKPVAQKGA